MSGIIDALWENFGQKRLVICFLLGRQFFSLNQTDNNSCGVYVCAVARAIVSNSRLPNEPNLGSFRNIFAKEILDGFLHEDRKSPSY